ncbi:MAG: hypothetical protein U0L20_06885, partial [Ruminococcus sp.]|nr:hypothetical protein [Ruminococcus sp.]
MIYINSFPEYNDEEAKNKIIKELLGKIGDYSCVKQPFHCDYGKFIEIGDGSFLNYDCIILGACKVIAAGNPCCVIREITEED